MAAELMTGPLRAVAEAVLRPYAQILLSRNLVTGALLLCAITTYPRLCVATLGSVGIAAAVAMLIGLGTRAVREGGYGCSAVLTTLALAAFTPDGGEVPWLMAAGAALSVLVTAASESILATAALPGHSLPFVATTWIIHLASRCFPATNAPWQSGVAILPSSWVSAGSWLDLPASIAFVHGVLPGLLVMVAIAVHSRIALGLAVAGAATSVLFKVLFRGALPWSIADDTAGFNSILTAMAIGGVWFVPHPTATLLAVLAAGTSTLATYAAFAALAPLGLPVISLPFGVVVIGFLAAARKRLEDRAPQSALPGETPEETLGRALVETRRAEGARTGALRLPFRGQWYVSQGYDGAHTHRGPWRHGLDFESRGRDGRPFERDGRELTDYGAYGLPILAAGAGTVVHVVDGIPDNRPGEMDLQNNWGNAVVLCHGPALYSVYAHLQPGSIRAKLGQLIPCGAELGRCGNSGRSATPHLHFQVQRTAVLGAPTIAAGFCHYVSQPSERKSDSTRERYHAFAVPLEGKLVRPLLGDDALAQALHLAPGTRLTLRDLDTGREESIAVELDLLGATVLRNEYGVSLLMDLHDWGLMVRDYRGDARSLLFAFTHALPRLPLDRAAIHWEARIPRHFGQSSWRRPIQALVDWCVPRGFESKATYRVKRQPGVVQIRGRGRGFTSRATLSLLGDPHRIELKLGPQHFLITLQRSHTVLVGPDFSRQYRPAPASCHSHTGANGSARPGESVALSSAELTR